MTMTKGKEIEQEICALLRARNILIWVNSREEIRAERIIMEAAASAKYDTLFWDCATGLHDSTGAVLDGLLQDPNQVIGRIRGSANRQVWVLRDLHSWLMNPVIVRGLRSLARDLQSAPRNEARAIVILAPSSNVPPDLSGQAVYLDFPLPDRQEMTEVLESAIESLPESVAKNVCPESVKDLAIDAAMGLTSDAAASCYAKSIVTNRKVDPAIVSKEKKKEITKKQGIEWIEPDPRGLDAVGGLEEAKAWLTTRRMAFSKEAREYGLPSPKGVLIVGVPGCGKSLLAKTIPMAWGIPLLRLDMGSTKSKWVGESEANIRKALQLAETIAPCVLWLDEIEKSLAGSGGTASDGGVAADALGAVLSWMQDHTAPVFVVATANDVEKLPAELLRKGRFDELFFVDLPQSIERISILETAMSQYKRDSSGVDCSEVAEATDGFSGAEIAALVPDAMFKAFSENMREITTEDLLEVASKTVPLSRTSSERISKIRDWAKGRARLASAISMSRRSTRRAIDVS